MVADTWTNRRSQGRPISIRILVLVQIGTLLLSGPTIVGMVVSKILMIMMMIMMIMMISQKDWSSLRPDRKRHKIGKNLRKNTCDL